MLVYKRHMHSYVYKFLVDKIKVLMSIERFSMLLGWLNGGRGKVGDAGEGAHVSLPHFLEF